MEGEEIVSLHLRSSGVCPAALFGDVRAEGFAGLGAVAADAGVGFCFGVDVLLWVELCGGEFRVGICGLLAEWKGWVILNLNLDLILVRLWV